MTFATEDVNDGWITGQITSEVLLEHVRLMVLRRIDRECIGRLFGFVALNEVSCSDQLMIPSFSCLEVAQVVGSELLLVEKSNNQINILRWTYLIRPNDWYKGKAEFRGIVKLVFWQFDDLLCYLRTFLYYLPHFLYRYWILGLNDISGIHSLPGTRKARRLISRSESWRTWMHLLFHRKGRTSCYFLEVLLLNILKFLCHFLDFLLKLKSLPDLSLDLLSILILDQLLSLVERFLLVLKLSLELCLKMHIILIF